METNQQLQCSGSASVLERDDAALVRAAADGDDLAWSALVQRFAGLVWAATQDYGLGATDAADVSRVTWLRLGQHLRRLPDSGQVGIWLARTACQESRRSLLLSGQVAAHDRLIAGPRAEAFGLGGRCA
ncbi:MAG: RNA polymerase sigma factor [Egibacteraceae bacterium]